MKNRNRKLNAYGAYTSKYFNLPPRQSASVLEIHFNGFGSINKYFTAFSRLFSLNLTASRFSSVLCELIFLYVYIYVCLDTRFVSFVSSNTKSVSLPSFINILMLKISMEVNSKNKITGWINGDVHFSDLSDLHRCFPSPDDEIGMNSLISSFSDSPFSRVLGNKKLELEFRKLYSIKYKKLCVICSQDDSGYVHLFNFILSELSSLSTICLQGDEIPYFDGVLEFSISNQIGIHRFRNSHAVDVFYTSQSSCVSLSEETLNLFSVFLKIFSPEIKQLSTDGFIQNIDFLPGDVEFSIDFLNLTDAWAKLLSFSDINNPPVSKGSKSRFQRNTDKVPTIDILESDPDTIKSITGFDIDSLVIASSTDHHRIYCFHSTLIQNNFAYFRVDDGDDFSDYG